VLEELKIKGVYTSRNFVKKFSKPESSFQNSVLPNANSLIIQKLACQMPP